MLKKFLPLLCAVLLLAACPGNETKDVSQSGPSKASQSSTANPQAVPENSTAMNPTAPPQKDVPASRTAPAANPSVDVQLTEYEIRMPDVLPAGTSTLQVSNAGKEEHSLVIEGDGAQFVLPDKLERGDTASLDVTLKPGTYQVYCPVENHKTKGMTRTVMVK